jgi:hypothetical protein
LLLVAVASPTYLAASWNTRTTVLVHPAKLALELARINIANRPTLRASSRIWPPV